MNFALNEYPLAHCQLRQSKLFLPYPQHNGLVVHSLKFFVAKKSVPNVEKLTLTVLPASDLASLSIWSLRYAFMSSVATDSIAFGCSTQASEIVNTVE